jgi:deoxyribose-phosphate aldolase
MIDFSKMTKWDVGKLFDFSVLPKDTTEKQIREGCRRAIEYNCKAFCFSSSEWTPIVAEELKGTDLMVGAGIGFPFGQQSSAVKAFETEEAVRLGATVLDNVMNVGDMKDKKYDKILNEFKEYKKAAGPAMTKMIIETCMLTRDEISTACKLIAEVGIDWAKTSTGQYAGPSISDVIFMVHVLKDTKVKVKVAGVKAPRAQNAYAFFLAGAELIGTQGAIEIIEGLDDVRKIGMIPEYKG